MKSVEAWLSCSLLLMQASSLPAQAPQARPEQPETKAPALLSAQPLKEDPKDDELRRLLKARYNAALGEVQDGVVNAQHLRDDIPRANAPEAYAIGLLVADELAAVAELRAAWPSAWKQLRKAIAASDLG